MVDAIDSKVEVQMDDCDLTSLASRCFRGDLDAFNHQPQQSLLFICIHRQQLVLYVHQQMMQSFCTHTKLVDIFGQLPGNVRSGSDTDKFLKQLLLSYIRTNTVFLLL